MRVLVTSVVNLRDFRTMPGEKHQTGLIVYRSVAYYLPPDVQLITRSPKTRWPNLFRIGKPLDRRAPEGGSILTSSATRDDVITAYRWWLEHHLKSYPDYLEPLRGKRLACWCAPLPCHGDVILQALEEEA